MFCQSFELAELKAGAAWLDIAFCNSGNKIITFIGLNFCFIGGRGVVLKEAFDARSRLITRFYEVFVKNITIGLGGVASTDAYLIRQTKPVCRQASKTVTATVFDRFRLR